MAGSSSAGNKISERAKEWRTKFNESKSADRIRNLFKISQAYSTASQKPKADRTQLWADLVHAAGDRSTAKKVSVLVEFSNELIEKAVQHMRSVNTPPTKSSSATLDKRGTRGPDGQRVRRARGFSPTHLLVLTLIGDKNERQNAFEKCLQESWSLDDLRAHVKKVDTKKAKKPSIRPLRLAYATFKQADELQQLLNELNKDAFANSAKVIRKPDRDSAIANCDLATQQLKAVKGKLDGAIAALEKLQSELKSPATSEPPATTRTDRTESSPRKRSTKK